MCCRVEGALSLSVYRARDFLNWRNGRQVAAFEVLIAVLLGYYTVLTGNWYSYRSTRCNIKRTSVFGSSAVSESTD